MTQSKNNKRVIPRWLMPLGITALVALTAFLLWRIFSPQQAANLLGGNAEQQTVRTAQINTIDAVEAVEATGKLQAIQDTEVFWRTTGTVSEVAVQVGQQVHAGDILMTVNIRTVPNNIILAQADLVTAQNKLNDLRDPSNLQIAEAWKAVVDAREELRVAERDQKTTLNPPLSYYDEEIVNAESALTEAQQNSELTDIGDAETNLRRAQEAEQYNRELLGAVQTAYNSYCLGITGADVTPTPNYCSPTESRVYKNYTLAQAQQQYQDSVNDVREAELRLQQAQANNNQAISTAQANLGDAQQARQDAVRGPLPREVDAAQSRVDVAKARLAEAEEKYAELTGEPPADDVLALQAQIDAALNTLDSLNITAPFEGEVLDVNYQVGDTVQQNIAAVRLARTGQLVIDVNVDEAEVARVKIGQPATVTFDALPGKEVTGKVEQIDRFGQEQQGIVRYSVRIALDQVDEILLIGMTANVEIRTNTLQGALFAPLDAIQLDDQGEYVMIQDAANPQGRRVNVTTGLIQDDGVVVVSDELKKGDTVILFDAVPTNSGSPFGG
ncbi:MAG TPA: HlyD family efflux transporter periplasmic adaptor subunit [Anaerolineales bacterium]|nr:HlyD family efflux transporter periplasmic adaptor subunit [Anaerolineales bacterium]